MMKSGEKGRATAPEQFTELVVLVDLRKRNEALQEALKSALDETKKLRAIMHEERSERSVLTKIHQNAIEKLEADKEALLRRLDESASDGEQHKNQQEQAIDLIKNDVLKLRRIISGYRNERTVLQQEKDDLKNQISALKLQVKAAKEGEAKARTILAFHKSRNQKRPTSAPMSPMLTFAGLTVADIEDDYSSFLPPPTSPIKKGRRPASSPTKRTSPMARSRR